MDNLVPIFDVVSTTTHKTLRGPRGAIIMCREKFAKQIDTVQETMKRNVDESVGAIKDNIVTFTDELTIAADRAS